MNTAMILAAGRGERLRPFTDSTPKALCKINGIPLIEYHVTNLAKAGFQRIVINHAWLGGQIRQHLGSGARFGVEICYAPEPPGGLETGGGIVNALPLLGELPFLTVNADILTDYDFSSLKLPVTSMLHLILIDQRQNNHCTPPADVQTGDFGLSSTGMIKNNNRQFTFSGIACYRPELFCHLKPGRYSVTPLLRDVAMRGLASGTIYHGKWFDIGSPERLQRAAAFTKP